MARMRSGEVAMIGILVSMEDLRQLKVFYFEFIRSQLLSSLVFADSCLKFRFSFTRDSYKSFLLRHGSFSYVIVSQKTYTRDEGTICLGRGNNFYLLSLRKTFFTRLYCVESGRFFKR